MTLHPRWGCAASTEVDAEFPAKHYSPSTQVYGPSKDFMDGLLGDSPAETLQSTANARTFTGSTRLNKLEHDELEMLAEQRRVTPAELIRFLIHEEVQRKQTAETPTTELAEIVGVRLLVVNLLKPILLGKVPLTAEAVAAITANVKSTKKTLATEIMAGEKE